MAQITSRIDAFTSAAANLNWFQNGNPTNNSARYFIFTTAFGGCASFDVDEITAEVNRANTASQALFQSLGLRCARTSDWYTVSCHSQGGSGVAKSGLDLTSYEGLMRGTVYGPVVVPGNSDTSTFTKLLTGNQQGFEDADGSERLRHAG